MMIEVTCNLDEHACNLEEHACNLEEHACNLEEHAKSCRVAAADLEGAAPGVDDGVEHEFELQDEIGEQPQGGVVGQIHEVQHVVDRERRHTAHIHYATQKHVAKVRKYYLYYYHYYCIALRDVNIFCIQTGQTLSHQR